LVYYPDPFSMTDYQEAAIQIFKESGALMTGHFVLRSGLHSGHFFQCAQVGQFLDRITRLAEMLIAKAQTQTFEFDTVVAPAMGGLVIGQEVARQTGARFIFVEKTEDGLALRRGFKIAPQEKVLIVEDVITRGGRVQETPDILKEHQAATAGVWVLANRSEGKASFEVPLVSLVDMSFPTYEPDHLPEDLAAIPVSKPGS
jgi:orotate phosphoribosyltransferase